MADQDDTSGGTTVGSDTGKPLRRRRLSGAERRLQIANVAIQLVARVGLDKTTVTRIAEEVGMLPPSLYAHFSNREEILLAAVDILTEKSWAWVRESSDPDILKRLATLAESHDSFHSGQFEGFLVPMYEFLTAPRESGIPKIIGDRQADILETIAGFVEEGKRQGTIRADMDAKLAAWELIVSAWAQDVAKLMGLDDYLESGYYGKMTDLFLRDMAASPELVSHSAAASPGDGVSSGLQQDAAVAALPTAEALAELAVSVPKLVTALERLVERLEQNEDVAVQPSGQTLAGLSSRS